MTTDENHTDSTDNQHKQTIKQGLRILGLLLIGTIFVLGLTTATLLITPVDESRIGPERVALPCASNSTVVESTTYDDGVVTLRMNESLSEKVDEEDRYERVWFVEMTDTERNNWSGHWENENITNYTSEVTVKNNTDYIVHGIRIYDNETSRSQFGKLCIDRNQ